MLEVLEVLNRSFKAFLDQGDPRVKNWPLMQSPFPGMAMIVAYVYFVKVAGPQFMKKRRPFELRSLMAFYNFALVLINLYVFWGIGWYGYFNGYSLKCQPVDYSYNHDAVRMAQMGYYFYLTKFIEFADTIFFVLRKKDNQISALHVIHHSIVPFSLWFGIKFAPGGYNALFPFLNSLVHVIMYTYYGLAALGERYKKYLVWKKYMTYIQLAQFVCVIVYAISLWYNQCDISRTFIVMNFIHAALFLGLFLNFFIKSYIKKPPPKKSSPVLVCKDLPKMCLGEKLSEAPLNGERTHVKQLVSQLEKEAGTHLAQMHSSAAETCCHLNCGAVHCAKRSGRQYNYCIPESMNTYPKFNGLSVPESLKHRNLFKEL